MSMGPRHTEPPLAADDPFENARRPVETAAHAEDTPQGPRTAQVSQGGGFGFEDDAFSSFVADGTADAPDTPSVSSNVAPGQPLGGVSV